MRFVCYSLLLQIIFLLLYGVEHVRSCLPCFTTPAERDDICRYPVSLGKMEAADCLHRLNQGFKALNTITIAYSQIQDLKKYLKTFINEVKNIDTLYFPPAWAKQFEIKITEFVNNVKNRAASHPAAQCRPPCGLQKAARTFSCGQCAVIDCPFPITCPIEEMKVNEFDKTFIPCGGKFSMPHQLHVIWKFAKNIWSTDLSLFKEIKHKGDLFHILNPTRISDRGTYFCEILDDDDDILIRQFHYVNVQIPNDQDGGIMDVFKDVLRAKPPVEKEIQPEPTTEAAEVATSTFFHSNITYTIAAGVISFVLTIVVGLLWRYALDVDWEHTQDDF